MTTTVVRFWAVVSFSHARFMNVSSPFSHQSSLITGGETDRAYLTRASADVRLTFHAKNPLFLTVFGRHGSTGRNGSRAAANVSSALCCCSVMVTYFISTCSLLFCLDPFSLHILSLFYNYLPDMTGSGTRLHIKVSNPQQKGNRMIHSFHIELLKQSGKKHGEQI